MFDWRREWLERFGRTEPKIVCVGLNYRDHAEESGEALPAEPILFAKFASALCGDGEAIALPRRIGHVDAEAELAVVIGSRVHAISPQKALGAVCGYTCANDVSARDLQFADGQWFRGKAHDTFCPVGPRIAPVDELGEAADLRVTQRLNAVTLQDSRTSRLIFSVPRLVSFVSQVLTLEPGDLILTGTPAGVGCFREPKVSLQPGDLVEVELEGIGILHNPVVEAPDTSS
jgi:2-keto-4-pentenoate hydratase/2-oxohepta-3-ene-1,7-dioic acid hydratase in catechol pathway